MSVVLILVAVAFLLLLLGILYQAVGSARDRRRFLPPGEMVDVGGHRLHLFGAGEGRPAVVLEAGIAASSLSWSHIQPEVAKFTRVYSYDRAGLGWSDAGVSPRTCAQSVAELHALLRNADVPRPCVFVGHSFGGCVVRLYAERHPEDVAGMVLVDALHPNEWLHPSRERRRMLQGGVFFSHVGAFLARIGVVRFCLMLLTSGTTWFPKLFVRSLGSGVAGLTGRIVGEVRKLPPEVHPVVQALWCQPKCFSSMASHVGHLSESSAQAAACGALGDKPTVVLSGSHLAPAQVIEQDAVARLSTRGRHLRATQSAHWIHLDQPELVVHAIREVVETLRREA